MKRNNSRIKAMIVLYNYDITGEKIDYGYLNRVIQEEGEVLFDEDFFKELFIFAFAGLFAFVGGFRLFLSLAGKYRWIGILINRAELCCG